MLIRLLVGLLTLSHVLLAVLQQPIHTLRDLSRRRHDRFRAAGAGLNASIERAERILGVMAALRRHPERPRRAIGATTRAALEDLAGAAAVLRTQAQPAYEILLIREFTHVQANLAQDH